MYWRDDEIFRRVYVCVHRSSPNMYRLIGVCPGVCVCVQCRRCISAAIRVTTNQFLIYIYIRASDACAGQ